MIEPCFNGYLLQLCSYPADQRLYSPSAFHLSFSHSSLNYSSNLKQSSRSSHDYTNEMKWDYKSPSTWVICLCTNSLVQGNQIIYLFAAELCIQQSTWYSSTLVLSSSRRRKSQRTVRSVGGPISSSFSHCSDTVNRKEIKKTISQRIPFQQRFLLTWPKVMPCWFVLGFLRQRIALGRNHRTKQEHGAKKDVNSPFPGRVDGGHRVINQSLKSWLWSPQHVDRPQNLKVPA